MAKECFGNDLIVFTISGFLPGEYSLRTFPLICKATQSLRLSLYLQPYSSTTWWDFEGRIYGIYTKWQDFERVISRGHLITALWVEGDIFGKSHLITPISSVKELHLSSFFSSTILSLFPSLTTLVVTSAEDGVGAQLLSAIWKLSTLASLTLTACYIEDYSSSQEDDGVGGVIAPAFAHSLHSLKVDKSTLLDILAPFCRALQYISSPVYHEIMINNPTLTSLSISYSLSTSTIDLTPHSRLVKFNVINPRPFTTLATHSSLEEVSFFNPLTFSACQFLPQCPRLKQLSISGCHDWQDVIKIISTLNSETCKQLTLNMYSRCVNPPSVDEVEEMILLKGFQIMNDDFFFCVRDAVQRWGRILELAPNMQNCQRLSKYRTLDQMFIMPSFFTSFPALSVLELHTDIEWNHDILSRIPRTCSILKVLKVTGFTFSGALDMQSVSLRQVDLKFSTPFSGFSLKLPNLTHLNLRLSAGESILLQGLLNGDDPLIQLPRLRVFSVDLFISATRSSRSLVTSIIQCKTGHASLTQVNMVGNRKTEIKLITLQNVPCLREITLALPSTLQLVLDIPGHCDVSLCTNSSNPSYTRKSYSEGSHPFVARLSCDDEQGWIELR